MSLITIIKDNHKKKVSRTTFEDYFKNAGWIEAGENPASVKSQEAQEEPLIENSINTNSEDEEVNPEAPGDHEEDEWDKVLDEEEEEEVQKPISEMNKEELIKFAKDNNISLNGLTKINQYREAIRTALKDKEV